MKALIRIVGRYRPISGDLIGYRLQACVPNLAARRMKKTSQGFVATAEEVPSFRAPYLIAESGDFQDKDVPAADRDRFLKRLLWEGFTSFEVINDNPAPAPSEKTLSELRRAGLI